MELAKPCHVVRDRRMKSLTVQLPDELAARIEAEALDRKISISDVVREHLNCARSSNPRRALFDAIFDVVSSAERLPEVDRLPEAQPSPNTEPLPEVEPLPDDPSVRKKKRRKSKALASAR